MTGNVVNMIEHKPHLSGEIRCLTCLHEWVANAEIGTIQFECPECGLNKGQTIYPCAPDEGEVWTCNCGSQTFFVRANNFLCTNCGIISEYNVL